MGQVYPGYMGLADIGGVGQVRFADASITATQSVEAPDLIMGDYDHDAYVYGKIEVGGSISGPVTETFAAAGTGLWDWATARDACGNLTEQDATLYYFCNPGGVGNSSRTFSGMLVNSVNFSCSAGDVAQFSVDLMGRSAGAWGTSSTTFTDAEKLVTWDKVGVTVTAGADTSFDPEPVAYSSFDFTVSNNLEAVYSLGQADLFPYDIVPGLRTITGSISVYNIPGMNGFDNWDAYTAASIGSIEFDIGGVTITASVRYHRVEPASSVGPIMSTVGFTGVGHQTF